MRCLICGAPTRWNITEPDGETFQACDKHLGMVIETKTTAGIVHVSRAG